MNMKFCEKEAFNTLQMSFCTCLKTARNILISDYVYAYKKGNIFGFIIMSVFLILRENEHSKTDNIKASSSTVCTIPPTFSYCPESLLFPCSHYK